MAQWTGFYTIQDVSRLSRIPLRTLYDWQSKGIIAPALELVDEDGRTLKGYTYAQLTIIRMIRSVREGHLDFKHASIALMHLYDRLGEPTNGWAGERVYVLGNEIYAERPDEWRITVAERGGQMLEERLFGDFFVELRSIEEGESILVPSEYRAHVTIDPDVMDGEPVLRGTRIPTRVVAALASAGRSAQTIARLYGVVSRAAVEAAIGYERALDDWQNRAAPATAS